MAAVHGKNAYGAGKPVTELRHSLLARPADCRSPGQRSSSRTRPPCPGRRRPGPHGVRVVASELRGLLVDHDPAVDVAMNATVLSMLTLITDRHPQARLGG